MRHHERRPEAGPGFRSTQTGMFHLAADLDNVRTYRRAATRSTQDRPQMIAHARHWLDVARLTRLNIRRRLP